MLSLLVQAAAMKMRAYDKVVEYLCAAAPVVSFFRLQVVWSSLHKTRNGQLPLQCSSKHSDVDREARKEIELHSDVYILLCYLCLRVSYRTGTLPCSWDILRRIQVRQPDGPSVLTQVVSQFFPVQGNVFDEPSREDREDPDILPVKSFTSVIFFQQGFICTLLGQSWLWVSWFPQTLNLLTNANS